ncbi:MAG: hypothetical protein IV100_12225 [Myxococcales bacterium]|nr:hypothetical protein [Myxococcales bacterium]
MEYRQPQRRGVRRQDGRRRAERLTLDAHRRVFQIATSSAWLVRKPTRDLVVTSVECCEADGRNLASLIGERKPGWSEPLVWRSLVEASSRLS